MSAQEPQTPSEPEELRLFPLNLVLFPGMALPLRIFEERYKIMIEECLDEDLPFGVLLIKEGPEVGSGAMPHTVGTIARITQAKRLEEGRFRLQTRGESRFRLREVTQDEPFLMGNVEYLEEGNPGPLEDLTDSARDLLSEYWKILVCIKGGWVNNVETPQEPVPLSYAVAQTVARPALVGQYLLQLSSAKERLERAIPLLEERLGLAKEELSKQRPYQGPRLN
jgi:Lon protease-like protein